MTPTRLALLPLLSLTLLPSARADALVGWRTDGTGRYPDATPPAAWAPDTNIAWQAPMPAPGNGTPVLVGDRLFVTAEPNTLLCVAAADGKILWQKTAAYADIMTPEQAAQAQQDETRSGELQNQMKPLEKALHDAKQALEKAQKPPPPPAAEGADKPAPPPVDEAAVAAAKAKVDEVQKQLAPLKQEHDRLGTWRLPPTHPVNGYASTTPVSDGQRVWVLFGNGVAACFDRDGNRVWMRLVEKPNHGWGHSASPVLAGGRLITHIHRLIALDLATGEEAWRLDAGMHWGTPVVTRIGDTEVVVTPGGDVVRATDGKAVARNLCSLEYNAPIVHDGIAYFIQHKGKAVRLPATIGEPQAVPEVLWTTEPEKDRYYASPVWVDGLLYAVTQKGVFSAIDATTGQVVYRQELNLGGTAYPSITFAAGVLFVSSDNGTTAVVQPGREFKELGRNKLEPFRASPVSAGGRLFLRGQKNLYCIEARPVAAPAPAP